MSVEAPPDVGTPLPPSLPSQAGPTLPDALIEHLAGTAAWARLMAVLGFIAVGFMVLGGLMMLAVGSFLPTPGGSMPFPVHFLGLFYFVFAAIYLLPLLPLTRFANSAGRLRDTRASEDAIEAVRQSRAFWRRIGILSLIGIGLGIVMMIVGLIAAVVAGLASRAI